MLELIVPAPPWTHSMAQPLRGLAGLLRATNFSFHTVTPATHSRVLARGQQWALDLADAFGWNLPFQTALLGAARCDELAAAGVIAVHGDGWKAQLRAASLGDLILFHSAYPTEQGDAVFFGPDTYRFVAAIKRSLPMVKEPVRVIEIGCGAGAAAIVLARALPKSEVIAVDINASALVLTAHNASIAGVTSLRTVNSDILRDVDGVFDLIVANPPYMLDGAERAYRHGGGGHGEGLAIAIVRDALCRLAPAGRLLLYTGTAFVRQRDQFYESAVPHLIAAGCHWQYEELDPDVFGEELEQPNYADIERIAAVWLTVTMPPAL